MYAPRVLEGGGVTETECSSLALCFPLQPRLPGEIRVNGQRIAVRDWGLGVAGFPLHPGDVLEVGNHANGDGEVYALVELER